MKETKQAKEPKTKKEDNMSNMFEKMKSAIESMKAEQIKAEVQRIKIEKAKRYEYHKKYNQAKKDYEAKLLKKAETLNLK